MGREINHIELSTKNLMETKRFYSRLFRWSFQMYGDDYMMFTTSKKGVGGGFQLSKKVTPGTTRFYVTVDSIPKTQQKAASLGGKIGQRKKAIGGGHGYWGTIKDPHGNLIGVWSKK
ncbi:MAG TPA: VOC family protein [Candidatus Bathyarchaeia archaeon]|nr:VOC family protein [Candidatus Bathyarchaeia archaeon]